MLNFKHLIWKNVIWAVQKAGKNSTFLRGPMFWRKCSRQEGKMKKMLRCKNIQSIFNNSVKSCLSGVTIKLKKIKCLKRCISSSREVSRILDFMPEFFLIGWQPFLFSQDCGVGFLGCRTCGVKPGAIAHAKSDLFPFNRVLEIKADKIQVVYMARLLHGECWFFFHQKTYNFCVSFWIPLQLLMLNI